MRQAPKILSRHIHLDADLQNISPAVLVSRVSANLAKRPGRCNKLPIMVGVFQPGCSGTCSGSGRLFLLNISVRTECLPASQIVDDRTGSPGVRICDAFSADKAFRLKATSLDATFAGALRRRSKFVLQATRGVLRRPPQADEPPPAARLSVEVSA